MNEYRQKRRQRWLKYTRLKNEGINFLKPDDYYKLKKYEFRKKSKKFYANDRKRINDIKLPSKIDFEENIDNILVVSKQIEDYMGNPPKKPIFSKVENSSKIL
jgi:hypothetical protein